MENIKENTIKFDCAVIYDGKYYPAGEEITPEVEEIEEINKKPPKKG